MRKHVQKAMANEDRYERERGSARAQGRGRHSASAEQKNTLNSDIYNYFNNYNSKPETINSYF